MLGRDPRHPRIQHLQNCAFSHELSGLLVWIRHAGKEFANLFPCLGFQEAIGEIDGLLADRFDLCKGYLGHLTGMRDLNAVEVDPTRGAAFLVGLFVAFLSATPSFIGKESASGFSLYLGRFWKFLFIW